MAIEDKDMKYQKQENTNVYQGFEYVVASQGVTIIGFDGDSSQLSIPAELPEFSNGEGKRIRVIGLAPYAFYNNRSLVKILLPDSVERIGYHCFFDCRNMKEIQMADTVLHVEDGAFKNCESLFRINIRMIHQKSACIKGILAEQNKQVEFLLEHLWKKERPVPCAKIIIPMYQLDFEANVEARIINQVTYGSGAHYRECVTERDFDYAAYDAVFSVARTHDTKDTLIPLVAYRLEYPYALSEARKEVYQEYLSGNVSQAVRWACERERIDILGVLTGQKGVMESILDRKGMLQKALDIAHVCGKVSCISYLLEYSSKIASESGRGRERKDRFRL